METAFIRNSAGWLLRAGPLHILWLRAHQSIYLGWGAWPVIIV